MTNKSIDVKEELMKELLQNLDPKKKRAVSFKIFLWGITVGLSSFIKRFFDFIFSLFFIILFSPVYIITALCIVIESPGSVIYKQARVGKNGCHFNFYKFRSMVLNADKLKDKLIEQNESQDGVIFKMKKDPRITRTGRFIRRFSIDELPQLFNVLIGDMSLVGPRPPVPREVAEYTLDDRKRLHVTPGITCIWQVSGRSDIPFNEQVELDKEYIRSKGLKNDILILLKTIPAVLSGKGAY
jgi:lipopolysaccharide/colanic/teichoic acid biosynthesis glycosyltransferase